MRSRVLVAVVLALPAVAGCLSLDSGQDTGQAASSSLPPSEIELDVRTERTLVTEPGHRISEFSVAKDPRDPSRLVVSAMDLDDDQGASNCVLYKSLDGGDSWDPLGAPFGQDLRIKGDPWVTFAPDGSLHSSCIDVRMRDDEITQWLYHVRGNLAGDWSEPARVPMLDPEDSMDKSAIGTTSTGEVLTCAADLDADHQLTITRSTDGGATWDPIAAGNLSANCNGIQEGPEGVLHVLYCRTGETPCEETGTVASTDGGRTWEDAVRAGSVHWETKPERSHRYLPDTPEPVVPSMAVSPSSGGVFVAWQTMNDEDRYRVTLQELPADGDDYTPRSTPIPEDHRCSRCHVTRPTLAADADGRLAMLWKVTRGTTLETREIWFSASGDEGQTWADPIQLAELGPTESKADPRHAAPHPDALVGGAETLARSLAEGEPSADEVTSHGLSAYGHAFFTGVHSDGGDYWTMTSNGDGFVPMWVDRSEDGTQQLWSAVIAVEGGTGAS